MAGDFYTKLGAALNPVGSNHRQVHVNMGLSQLHMPFKLTVSQNEPVEVAQQWRGQVEYLTNDRLEDVALKLKEFVEASDERTPGLLRLTSPWDSLSITLREAPADASSIAQRLVSAGCGHAGGFGQLISMRRLVHSCRPGHAASIAGFYSKILQVEVRLESRRSLQVAIVPFGKGSLEQTLEFEENLDAPAACAYDEDESFKYHICMYLPADAFEAAFLRAEKAGLVWVNSRFEGGPPEFASPTSLAEVKSCGQFRVKDMRDPSTGKCGLVLEHEIRSPTHKCFPMKGAFSSSLL
eukprot:CAMPEP_0197627684 /NCGR_PEP_ID=MMETSP1338-20131121/6230_1 /TAXON_ID=43686 ORGANISM="Pelagodinium beii, Strain RCC1491" /NCGR_SAMPLE_ID=MMETSP1338 /ASSEMBLY_ACC=CAM_ASM_000754 /LENGTH=295 /DNA_ID=CAMNT_0043198473 /DNA_START=186 /DNA_END=1073 /DNA_ORIENTATION=+